MKKKQNKTIHCAVLEPLSQTLHTFLRIVEKGFSLWSPALEAELVVTL